jgi:hypothetical protein
MKSISCLTSICLVTSALAITAACHPAAARSNSEQPSAVSSNQLLLAGRGSRPAQVEQAPEEQHRSVGRGGGWKAAPSDDSNHRSVGRGGGWVNGESHSSGHRSVGRGGSSASSHSSSHAWGRGGSSASSRHRHRSVGRGGGWVNAEPPRRNVWGVFEQDNEHHEHRRESDRNVFGIFGR